MVLKEDVGVFNRVLRPDKDERDIPLLQFDIKSCFNKTVP